VSTKTTNYGLIKPDETDTYEVQNFNDNMDTIDAQLKKIVDATHPVGSMYWSAVPTSPGTLFGGTWEQIKDRFILAAGDTYRAGDTDGEASHFLSESELPKITPGGSIANEEHSHGYKINYIQWNGDDHPADNGTAVGNKAVSATTDPATVTSTFKGVQFGGGLAHNNMPPYLVMYCWVRTA
jgi:hypothetical protein